MVTGQWLIWERPTSGRLTWGCRSLVHSISGRPVRVPADLGRPLWPARFADTDDRCGAAPPLRPEPLARAAPLAPPARRAVTGTPALCWAPRSRRRQPRYRPCWLHREMMGDRFRPCSLAPRSRTGPDARTHPSAPRRRGDSAGRNSGASGDSRGRVAGTRVGAGRTRHRSRQETAAPCRRRTSRRTQSLRPTQQAGRLAPPGPERTKPPRAKAQRGFREKSRRRPTLPGGLPPSTIGAGGLNCRVRNGNGCFPAAMATGNLALSGARPPDLDGQGHA